jgi:ABC-type multidrug transport system ATPase subunit
MSAILIVDSVVKAYRGNSILTGASLRAVPGELRALIGARKSGKSTLLRIAAGLISPDVGSVQFAGRSYRNMLRKDIAGLGLFLLPEESLFSNAWPIRAQLEMIREQFNGTDPDLAIATAGLGDEVNRKLDKLSRAERRRAEVAAAIVRRPRCVLADEPFRGLAKDDAADLTRLLRGLAAGGIAVVVSGSEMPELFAEADRVTWCTGGRTQEMGPPGAAIRSPQFRLECMGSYSAPVTRVAASARR